jgi:ABC-type lipoprotein release transport system permease subunit
VALLLGIVGGLMLFALAGARRTESSYPRFLRSVHASDFSIGNVGYYDARTNARVAALPEVAQSRTWIAFNTVLMTDGKPDPRASSLEVSGTFDGRFIDMDRFTPTHGRAFDPNRVDEIEINEHSAEKLGLRLNQTVELGTYPLDDSDVYTNASPPAFRTTARIVGIGVLPDELIQDDADRSPRALLTPAFSRMARKYATFGVQGLILKDGNADIPAVRSQTAEFMPSATTEFHETSVDVFHAQHAVRPFSIALALFGLIAGVAGIVLVAQALTRAMRLERDEHEILRAIGTGPGTILRASFIAPAVAIVCGTALAVVLAIAASPAMPIGPVRRVQTGSAFNVDSTVIGLGALLFLLIFGATTVITAWRNAPHRARSINASRPSYVVGAASSAGMEPVPLTGLRFTFERADAARATTPRAVMVGGAIAIAALIAAATFGASLGTLVDEPHLYGWNWDAAMTLGDGYDNFVLAKAQPILDADPHIAGWSGAHFGSASLSRANGSNARDVSLLGMKANSTVSPPLLHGRMLRTPDEIVLGPETATQLRVRINDDIKLSGDGAPRQMRVVGIATFPTIGQLHAGHTSLGVGGIVVPDAVPGHNRDILGRKHPQTLGPNAIFVRFKPGSDSKAELTHLRKITQPLAGFSGIDVYSVQRPAEIVNSGSLGSAPVLLAVALSAGALLSLALALASSVRYRRRDLTILKTLGFTQRQLGATVAWHATTMIVVALLIGVPVGIFAGRAFWSSFADTLDVVAHPDVPVLAVCLVGVAAVVVANIVAAVPARVARRVNPRALLRGE